MNEIDRKHLEEFGKQLLRLEYLQKEIIQGQRDFKRFKNLMEAIRITLIILVLFLTGAIASIYLFLLQMR